MARVEVQYAVRVTDGRGGHWVLVNRYPSRACAEDAAGSLGPHAEVVAQAAAISTDWAVMATGDWGAPDDVEQAVRDLNAKPEGIIKFEGRLTEEEYNEFVARWRAQVEDSWILIQPPDDHESWHWSEVRQMGSGTIGDLRRAAPDPTEEPT